MLKLIPLLSNAINLKEHVLRPMSEIPHVVQPAVGRGAFEIGVLLDGQDEGVDLCGDVGADFGGGNRSHIFSVGC